jgi:hypothetical protein
MSNRHRTDYSLLLPLLRNNIGRIRDSRRLIHYLSMSGLGGCLGIENDQSTWKENSLANKITSLETHEWKSCFTEG